MNDPTLDIRTRAADTIIETMTAIHKWIARDLERSGAPRGVVDDVDVEV